MALGGDTGVRRGTRNFLLLLLLGSIVIVAAILTVKVLQNAIEKNSGWVVAGFLLLIMSAWLAFEWILVTRSWKKQGFANILEARKLARFGLVAIGTPLAISQALPLYEPGPLDQADVSEALNSTLDDREQIARSELLGKVPGLWGEGDCQVAYRFEITPPAGLAIEWERRPIGEAEWKATGTIIAVDGNIIQTRGETPQEERGRAASFTYRNNGAIERLTWKDEGRDVSAELVRCA